jgi:microcystin-dependent protein
MALRIAQVGNDQFFDQNGHPAVGYKLFTYAEGTTTKADTFADVNGLAKHTNPIVLNGMGYPPAPIYLDLIRRYKFVFTIPEDTHPPQSALYTWDGISVGVQIDLGASAEYVAGPFPTFIAANQFQVPGDFSLILTAGRRVKLISGAGTHLGTVSDRAFGAGVTVVTIINDVGTLDPSLSAFFYGFLSASEGSVPDCYFDGLTTNFVGPVNFAPTSAFNLIPASILFEYAGAIAPPGYAFAYGQSYLRADFPGLFAAIGTAFGSVDALHFSAPDLRGCFPLGKDNMGGTAAGRVTVASKDGANALILGGRGGEQVHQLTVAEIPSHSHQRTYVAVQNSDQAGATNQTTCARGDMQVYNTGGDAPHNTMPPYVTLNYIIRLF